MKRTTKYVGLDVHQATIAASVREESGRVIARSVMPTEEAAIVEYLRGMRGTIFVAFEEGTQSQWLHDVLYPIVDDVVVCDTHGERRRGNKNDVTDADQLSERLRTGGLRRVYHGSPQRLELKELVRAYTNLVEDSTRVMLRIKAIFRARGIKTRGAGVYRPEEHASWIEQLERKGAQFRLKSLYGELDVISALRPAAKAAMVAEARRNPAWKILRSIPFFGEVRVALLLAIMASPHRFRTKRSIWAYAGLAVVTVSSADHAMVDGRAVRRRRAPMTRGLNRNHNRVLKDVQRSGQRRSVGSGSAPGFLQRVARARHARPDGQAHPGPQDRRDHVTTLEERRALRSSAIDRASKLEPGAQRGRGAGLTSASGSGIQDDGSRGSLKGPFRPACSSAESLT